MNANELELIALHSRLVELQSKGHEVVPIEVALELSKLTAKIVSVNNRRFEHITETIVRLEESSKRIRDIKL